MTYSHDDLIEIPWHDLTTLDQSSRKHGTFEYQYVYLNNKLTPHVHQLVLALTSSVIHNYGIHDLKTVSRILSTVFSFIPNMPYAFVIAPMEGYLAIKFIVSPNDSLLQFVQSCNIQPFKIGDLFDYTSVKIKEVIPDKSTEELVKEQVRQCMTLGIEQMLAYLKAEK